MSEIKTKKKSSKTGTRSGRKSLSRTSSVSKTKRPRKKASRKAAPKAAAKKPKPVKKLTAKKAVPKKQKKQTGSKGPTAARKRMTAPSSTSSTRNTAQKHKPPVKTPMPAYSGAKAYLFTSYSHKDMKTVFKVLKALNRSRYRIWYDEGIEPGNEWPEVVGKSVIKCSQFLVFMSPSASASRNVRNEINLAFNENKDIIVVFLDETRLSEGLRLQIGSVQYINKFETTEKEFYEKLKKVLKTEIRG